jgi:hypothetical protein
VKNIKNMKKIVILLTILPFLASCEKFLEEKQVTRLSYGYYETEQGCEALVNACYSSLRLKVGNEWSYGLFDYGTDEYMKGQQWGEPYAQPEYNDYTPNLDGHIKVGYPDIGDWWALIYNSIDRCNVAIEKIPLVTNGVGMLKDQEGKDIRMAEVRFIRAYQLFTLVQQFGAIPFSLEPSSGLEEEWPRVPVREVYEAILDDLQWAYEYIPETQDQYGRVTKDAVRHYWAKVLLTRASYVPDASDDPDNYDPGGDPTADLTKAAELIDEIHNGGRHQLVSNYADLFKEGNEVNSEVIFSIQYNDVVGLNYSNGSDYKNELHEFWFQQYDQDPGMVRNIEYGRPFRRLMITDYAIDVCDRLNDSRLRKSLLETYFCTQTDETKVPTWTADELLFAFDNVAPDGSWAVRYGDTIHAGDMKFASAVKIQDSEHVIVGDTALVFLINDENTTLTDRQMIAAGYTVYARYYWTTNADGSLNELVTYDRNNDLLDNSNSTLSVAGYSSILTSTWNRNKSPSLIKYWDRNKPDGYDSHWGTRDVFLARLAESYLIGAEAYGRLGNYSKAVEYINYVRARAAYADGEEKPIFWHKFDGGSPADATTSTVANMLIDETYWDDPSHDAAEMYPPGVSSKQDKFIHFILNERCREMLGEMVRWEDLKRTGTLIERAYAFNDDTRNAGTLQKFHRLRPIPLVHLDAIKENGAYLTPAERQAYQNPGY